MRQRIEEMMIPTLDQTIQASGLRRHITNSSSTSWRTRPLCTSQKREYDSRYRCKHMHGIIRGVIASAIADVLEMRNIHVRIELGCGPLYPAGYKTYLNRTPELMILLKDYGSSMDLDRVVFWTAHPDVLRSLIFSYWEKMPYYEGSHGSASQVTDKGDIYVGYIRQW